MLEELAVANKSAAIEAGEVEEICLPTKEFLTFRLGGEEYGVEVLKVQEIRRYDAVTKIPNAPHFIKGVANLRGDIVPIVDMRIKFNLGDITYDQFTVVIILNLDGRMTGIVVDGVPDVIGLSEKQMRPMPKCGTVIGPEYIKGLGSIEERMLILVDIEKLMNRPDMCLRDIVVN